MGGKSTLTPEEASRIMRESGIPITPETVRMGLQQGVFAFGFYIQMDKSPVYRVSARKLMAFLSDWNGPA